MFSMVLIFTMPSVAETESKIVLTGSHSVGTVMRTLSKAYMDKHSEVEVKIIDNTLHAAQEHVLKGEADAVMVTDVSYKKLNATALKFTPIAKRIIKRKGKIVGNNLYGIAAVKVSPELQNFLDFINSDEGKGVIEGISDVEPL